MLRQAMYPRTSLFAYLHPLRSAIATNFSCPGGTLIHKLHAFHITTYICLQGYAS